MDQMYLLVLLLCLCGIGFAEWDCKTYQNVRGNCVALDECPPLLSILNESKNDRNNIEILKKYTCGFAQIDPKVCCPATITLLTEVLNGNDCLTPNGNVGTCTKLENCSYMYDKIRNKGFVSDEFMEFIKKSRCIPPGTSNSLSVCCMSEKGGQSPSISSPSRPTTPGNPVRRECVQSAFPPNIDSKCCGIESNSDSRIFGGNETAIDQFPWLVMIEYKRPEYNCGGSLISSRYVLTAAHCLVGTSNKSRQATGVRVGEYNTTNPGEDCVVAAGDGLDCTLGAVSIPIESYVVHEQYDPQHVYQYHDIALIRLEIMINYTDFTRPICLPSSDFTISPPHHLELYISGWGSFNRTQSSSDVKLYAKVPYVEQQQCQNRYGLGKQSLMDTQLCAGGKVNIDSCSGDSGGPLMLLKNITYEAVGVISFGTKDCGLESWPSIYTKVYDYINWIRDHIKR